MGSKLIDDAFVTSLLAHIRQLEDSVRYLEARVERNAAVAVSAQERVERLEPKVHAAATAEAILHQAMASTAAAAHGPRHAGAPRDRHGLRVVKGGLAAFAPAAVLLFHGGPGPALGTVARWVWRAASDHVRYVVAAVLIAVGGALLPVASAGDLPAAHAPLMAVHGHDHDHDRPPARSLHRGAWHPRGRS